MKIGLFTDRLPDLTVTAALDWLAAQRVEAVCPCWPPTGGRSCCSPKATGSGVGASTGFTPKLSNG